MLGTSSSRAMKPDNLITFITEEAQHCVINDERTKNVESALAALGKKQRTGKHRSNRGKEKSTPGATCENCKTQATPRPTAGRKEEAKKVKGQGDETPRKERRRWKQQQQRK